MSLPARLAALLMLASCAGYTPLKLPSQASLAPDMAALDHGTIDVSVPLGLGAIAELALRNNPDLLAARAQHNVAQAQLLQAGLPPNPQLTGAILPLAAGVGTTVAWNAGLSYDVKSLVTLAARRRSARESAAQVDAQLLWQEWQVVGQARLLGVDLIEGATLRASLQSALEAVAGRAGRSAAAVRQGNATIAALTPDLTARESARAALDDLDRTQLSRRHQLAALLGLAPEAPIELAGSIDLPPLDVAAALALLPAIADRRPDLVALRLGYDAQNDKYRAAILGQFPALNFAVIGSSDNSNVRNVGPQITLDLPIFDRNQGAIAIETATRQQLHDEYATRLAAATGEIRAMLAEMARQAAQYRQAAGELTALRRNAGQADAAFAAHDLDERGYVDLTTALISAEQQVYGLAQSIAEQQVAIATLTGAGLPPLDIRPVAR